MRKVLAALTAAGVLVVGAVTASVVSRPAGAAAQDSSDSSTTTAPETTDGRRPDRPDRGRFVEDVLAALVDEGTITQTQADAIADAFTSRMEELRANRPRRPGFFGLRDMLEDGVIDADELASLPEDHPLRDPDGPAAEYLDDGELTLDELRQVAPLGGPRGWHGPRRGDHTGDGTGADEDATESSYSA